jgi:hypothetical protein
MNCASIYNTFTCSNAGSTNCTKVGVQIPVVYTAASCASTEMVLLTGSDYAALKAADLANSVPPVAATNTTVLVDVPPLQIDAAGGAQIGAAILGVWAFAYAFRTLIRMLRESDISTPDHETTK